MNFSTPTNKKTDTSIANLWYLLGLRSSLGIRVAILFIIPSSLSPLIIDRGEFGGSIFYWIGLITIVQIVFTLLLLGLQKLIHRSKEIKSHPVKTLIAFYLLQCVRGFMFGTAVVQAGLTNDPQYLFRMFTGGIFITMILAIVAISVASLDQHINLVESLEAKKHSLQILLNSMDAKLQSATQELLLYVQKTIEPKIREIDVLLSQISNSKDKNLAIRNLQTFIEDDLHPLSRNIVRNLTVIQDDLQLSLTKQKLSLPKRLFVGVNIRPQVTTLLLFITYVAASQRSLTLVEALPFVVITTMTLLVYLSTMRVVFRNLSLRLPSLTIVTIAIISIPVPILLQIQESFGIAVPIFFISASFFIGVVFAIANLAFTLLTAQQLELAQELELVLARQQNTMNLLHQKDWLMRRRVSQIIHGSLQSSLNAAVLKLGTSIDVNNTTIEKIRTDIASATKRIKGDNLQGYSLATAKSDLSQVWDGTMELTWNMPESVSETLARNEVASECLGEIVQEAVSNAAKHGSATKAKITINVDKLVVFVEVLDNGQAVYTGKTHGLGSELLNEVCTAWSLTPLPTGGTKLYAELTLEIPSNTN